MGRAVRYERFGGVDVLQIAEVETPKAGPGQVVVAMRATGINPGEATIRKGMLAKQFPSTFPSGQGSDLAGVVSEVGPGVEQFHEGDEVLGFVETRSSQADFVLAEAKNLIPRPKTVPWEVAGSLFVVGTTAYAAVRAVALTANDTVVVSGAAGGVGSIAVQLAQQAGARVIGIAGADNHAWLEQHEVVPVAYGDGLAERLRRAAEGKIDAFVDTHGGGYVDLAIELGVAPERIDTIIDFAAAKKHQVKTDGNSTAASADVLARLAERVASGKLEIPIAKTYPLAGVRDAYRELEQGHTRGKIVLTP